MRDLLHFNIYFILVVWNRTHNISEVYIYLYICYKMTATISLVNMHHMYLQFFPCYEKF